MEENLLGAAARLVPNEVHHTLDVASSRPFNSFSTAALILISAQTTIPADESTSSREQRIVASRRRHRHHHHETRAVSPPYGSSVECLGCSSQPLRSIDLSQFSTATIMARDFSPDGSFLVAATGLSLLLYFSSWDIKATSCLHLSTRQPDPWLQVMDADASGIIKLWVPNAAGNLNTITLINRMFVFSLFKCLLLVVKGNLILCC